MPQLRDGTIVPHYFGTTPVGRSGNPGVSTNVQLRPGEVKEIIYPSDQRSISKTWTEYRVEVQHKDAYHTGTVTTYPNCWVVNAFGGVADRSTFTLRADSGQSTTSSGLGDGSKVLLLCINGDQPNAVILGGLRDTNDNSDEKSDGHNLAWSFNGIQAAINDNGEFTLTFNGATNADGSLRPSASQSAQGTNVKLSQDGSVTWTQGNQSVKIDATASNITINSGSYSTIVSSAGTQLGGNTALDAIIKGTTFRLAQQSLHTALMTALTTLSGLLAAAGAALSAASVPNAIPIIGGAIAAPGFLAAGTNITLAAAIVTTMQVTIQAFETAVANVLSTQNFTS